MWLVDEILDRAPSAAVQTAPPAIVSGLTWCGVSLQDWVYIATLIYILINIFKPLILWLWRKRNER